MRSDVLGLTGPCHQREAMRLHALLAQHIVAPVRAPPPALGLGAARIAKGLLAPGSGSDPGAERVRVCIEATSERLAMRKLAGRAELAAAHAAPELACRRRIAGLQRS